MAQSSWIKVEGYLLTPQFLTTERMVKENGTINQWILSYYISILN